MTPLLKRRLSCAEAKEALASAGDLEAEGLPAIHETTFPNGESNSRPWFASSTCGGQHSNSHMQIGDEMLCNAEFDGDDSKRPCCIKSFDEISAEKMIRSD